MSEETTPTLSPLKRAFLAVQTLQSKVDELESARHEPIAIIGMSCRFPQAENLEQYWDLLARGGDAVTPHPDRWPKEMLDDDDHVGERGSRWGGFLSSIDAFDASFFSIAPREATYMDPQQRLFLEVCWEALENAGIAPDSLAAHPTGVFAGAATNDYPQLQLRGGDLASIGGHYASGIAHSIITGRISYLLGLSGPSISVDTACSSSLVAIHLACQALRAGDCEMALAGGTNAILLPDVGVAYARAGMAAQDGRCKVFDASADGFVRGEGSGVVVLKRLSKALADGDHIHALIRGSALNQDGASSSMTAPSGPAQEAVIRTALRAAGVAPADVSYVEAHGTGTVLGDPIEVQAIGAALGDGRAPGRDVFVGSVKSNFGHLEASAGIAGLIKIVLSMQHRAIPASLHCNEPNPMIPWDRLPVRVSTSLTPWDAPDGSRIAGISGFGFSGTNAHLIVAEAPAPVTAPTPELDRPANLLTLSAPTATGLRAMAARLADYVAAHPALAVADIAHTMNVGRARFRHRAAFVLDARASLEARLRSFVAGEEHAQTVAAEVKGSDTPRVMFLFSGQGSQHAGMARELYHTQPVFRRAIDECDALLRGTLDPGVLQILFPADGNTALLDETLYTQPVLFSVEYALAQMWLSWGVKPSALMGHSLGEFVAAALAGVMSLQDALRLVAVRGRLGQRLTSVGSMAAVLADVVTVRAVLAAQGNRVTIAALNAPESNVISGPTDAMEQALAEFSARGIEVRRLPISNAFHSPAIEPMLAEFEAAASAIAFGVQRIPVYSNLYGRRAAPGEMQNAQYWTRHLREEVRFAEGFASAVADGYSNFLEVGPHTILVGLGRQCFPNSDGLWLPTLRRGYDDWQIVLGSLAQMYVHGANIDWKGFDRDYARQRVVLPTYPFERQRFWVAPPRMARARRNVGTRDAHPLLARRINSPFVQETIFETGLSLETTPWLGDHRVLGAAVLPATAHLEAAWSAASLVHGDRVFALQDVDIHEALVTPEQGSRTMQLAVSPVDGARAQFRVMSTASDADVTAEWRAHASGSVSLDTPRVAATFGDISAIRARCTMTIPAERLYDAVAQRGIELGDRFRGVVELFQGSGEALGKLRAPADVAAEVGRFHVHPALLDAALHVVTAALFDADNLAKPGETYMPIALEQFRVLARPSGALWSHAVARPRKANESPVVDVRVYDDLGAPIVEVVGLQFRRLQAAAWAGSAASVLDDQLYHIEWQPVDAPPISEPATGPWPVPDPALVAASLSKTLIETATRHHLDVYVARMSEIDALCRDLVVEALRSIGWNPPIGERVAESTLVDRLGVVAQHRRLFHRLLAILAEDGILVSTGRETWEVRRALDAESAAPRLAALRANFPEAAGELGLLASAGPELGGCLVGRVDPLSLLFPGGSFDVADELYRRSPSALVANALARQAVERVVADAPRDARIRVLEIGAGTGGTTSFVLPLFPAARTSYTFTDLSPLFLARAEARMTGYPFVDYKLLDIERDPSTAEVPEASFDLVIAANVLHATRDLAETVSHARRFVRPGGAMLLLESTRPQRWIDLTFGLTDGWWRFADTALRPDYPLVDRAAWTRVLANAGFDTSASVPMAEGSQSVFEPNLVVLARAPRVTREQWLVFADDSGVIEPVAAELRAMGRDVITVRRGERFEARNDGFIVPATDPTAYSRLLDEIARDQKTQINGIIHAWSLDASLDDSAGIGSLHEVENVGIRSVLYATQVAATHDAAAGSRLVLITRGVQAARAGESAAPAHATIWGFANTIRLELPDLDCLCIDLDSSAPADVSQLAARVVTRVGESQLAVREGAWLGARLTRQPPTARHDAGATDERVALVNTTPGVLDGLRFVPISDDPLGPNDVEIRVNVSALNFRDVLVAMAMYPGATAADRLGGECAGEVAAVGANVSGFTVGQSVVAMGAGGLGSYVRVNSQHVVPLPARISAADAVTVPSVFVTAWHALYDLAELRAGERVLIHAGAGGVGLAAIQLAKRVGAEVFATAGSPAKREFLASLGVEHVMDSRSTAYADAIARITGGAGVDVILNSLTDVHLAASMSALAPNGRFVELGKRGIWTNAQVAAARPSAKYFVVDLLAVGANQPEIVGDVLCRVWHALEAGEIQPLPHTDFASSEIESAFRYMAQAKHVGKIVVTRPRVATPAAVRGDGAYLVTGGLGGLGLTVAEWLVARGAGYVVLMGRREPNAVVRARIDVWNTERERVVFARGDVGVDGDVRRVVDDVARRGIPLRGVIHSAGVLHDAVIVGQDWSNFAETFASKVDGAWSLHQTTRSNALDFFVLFSSISSVLGSPGQGNHAAANAFMDALANFRRARGLPALSINWGAWSDVGAANERGVGARIGAQGMGTISPELGVALLERVMIDDGTQTAVMPVDWSTFAAHHAGGRLRSTLFATLNHTSAPASRAGSAIAEAKAPAASEISIRDVAPAVRWDVLLDRMRSLTARVLGLDASAPVDLHRPLQELGLDSLMAVELRNSMKKDLGLERPVAATIVFDHPTVAALVEYVGGVVFGWPPRGVVSTSTPTLDESADNGGDGLEGLDLLDQLENMSPAEIEQLLAKRMTAGD